MALYADALLAQVLTAATSPQQVTAVNIEWTTETQLAATSSGFNPDSSWRKVE